MTTCIKAGVVNAPAVLPTLTVFDRYMREFFDPEYVCDHKLKRSFISWMFGAITVFELQRHIRRRLDVEITNAEMGEFRVRLYRDGYILFHLKPYLFWCYQREWYHPVHRRRCVKAALKFDVAFQDRSMVEMFQDEKTRRMMHRVNNNVALSPKRYRTFFLELEGRIAKSTRSVVYRRLRFIYQQHQNSETDESLYTELIAKGLQTFGMRYPRMETEAHALNLIRKGVENHSVNIIMKHTRGQRANLVREADGSFQAVAVAFSEHAETTMAENPDEPMKPVELLENKIAVLSLVERAEGDEREAFEILMGLENRDFTKWLRANAERRDRGDCEVVVERMIGEGRMTDLDRYIAGYFGRKPKHIKRWRAHLKEQLV